MMILKNIIFFKIYSQLYIYIYIYIYIQIYIIFLKINMAMTKEFFIRV